MKKIAAVLIGMAAAGQAFAQAGPAQTCNAPASSGAGTTVTATAGTTFIVRDFQPRCSANVFASFQQNTVAFAVGSASSKGKNRFVGSTGGGGISGTQCAGVTCVVGDSTAQLAATLAAAT